jgi:hypothetical protein
VPRDTAERERPTKSREVTRWGDEMATIEQYGSGPYEVRIADEDREFVGTYRFPTAEEAREFRAANGGRLRKTREPLAPLFPALPPH